MRRFTPYYIYIVLGLWGCTATAQTTYPKREVRAVWLTTLSGLDWPQTLATSDESRKRQQQELCDMLDALRALHINTVLLQTRVRGTVIYPSAIEPWDNCLTGAYGRSPGYDPLGFAIEECHKRGMELHAWIVTIPCFKTAVAGRVGASSVLRTHPSLCRRHKDMWYLDPGKPETADYLAALCKEVTERYDVDGIHLDYIRYPENATSFPDQATYRQYGRRRDKASWRRDNITHCVRRIYDAVKQVKPWVKVSSSPVGKHRDLQRFSSGGWNAYNAVFQDAQGWLREGIHDMLFPMMYFQGRHFYPFAADWQENCAGRPVVAGLGIYFLSPQEKDWERSVIEREMNVVRALGLGGQAFFRTRFLLNNVKSLATWLGDRFFPYPALTPACTWLDSIAPTPPHDLVLHSGTDGCDTLCWQPATDNRCGQDVRYQVYASCGQPADVSRPEQLVAVNLTAPTYVVDRAFRLRHNVQFAVTAVDRFGNESAPARYEVVPDGQPSSAGMPHDGRTLALPPLQTEFVLLTDSRGRLLRTARYAPTLSIADLPAGVYTVRTLQKKGISRRIGMLIK